MSQFQFNVSLGREVELYNRVVANDPANSALIMAVLAEAGLESDAALKDKDTLAAVVAGTTNEVTNTNYARKVLTNVELSAYTVDDTSDRIVLFIPAQTFSTILAGDVWAKVVIAYDADTTAGTDSDIIPITAHDLILNGAYISPVGDAIGIDFSVDGFVIAR